MESCKISPLKWAYNEFFEGKKAVFSRSRWQEQSDIIFRVTSGKGWIEEYLGDGVKICQEEWTRSIAVGSRSFIEDVKALLGFRAKGRAVIEGCEGYQLREGAAHYQAFFEAENDDIGHENTYL